MYNNYVFSQRYTSAILRAEGTKKNKLLKRACSLLRAFDEYIQDEILDSWSELFKLPKTVLENYVNGKEKEIDNVDELINYLNFEFKFKQDIIKKELEIYKISNNSKYTIDELKLEITRNKLPTSYLKTILNPENTNYSITETYNPMKEFLLNLGKNYQGDNVIEKVANCIPAYNFEDEKLTEHYTNRKNYLFKKWIIKTTAQFLDFNHNESFLLWLSKDGGSGKSWLNRWLYSVFNKKYIEVIRVNDEYKPLINLASYNAFIDFDELPLQKSQDQKIKSYLSSNESKQHIKGSTNKSVVLKRYGVFLGSSNKVNRGGAVGYLHEFDGGVFRRFSPIELGGKIDYETYTKLDINQFWGQAVLETQKLIEKFKHGNLKEKQEAKNWLTWENDVQDLVKENFRYLNNHTIKNKGIILDYIQPSNIEDAEFLSSSQIIKRLNKKKIELNINPVQLGLILSKNSFIGKHNGIKKGWYVKFVN